MLPPTTKKALLALLPRIAECPDPWALTGSTAFALRGLAVQPRDIDLQTDAAGAYNLARHLPQKAAIPIRLVESVDMRSHLGAFEIEGVRVEIMGDVQKRRPDGRWSEPPELLRLIEFVCWEGHRVPLLPLAYEADAYTQMGRVETAAALRTFMAGHESG